MANKDLSSAKKAKKDEFYTQYVDIQKEIEAYLEYNSDAFHDKVVYCNCDDPYESNFFRFFVLNFKRLGLKQLITTSYKSSSVANTQLRLFDSNSTSVISGGGGGTAVKFILNEVYDINGDGDFDLNDVASQLQANENNEWEPLEEDGDFRSDECIELLKQSDIVITNPPFSLFRTYVKQLIDYDKKFLIIGNINAVSYKEIFPYIRENKVWLGPSITSGDRWFGVPPHYPLEASSSKIDEEGNKFVKVKGVRWFTNIDHGYRHRPLSLMTMDDNIRHSKHKKIRGNQYYKYDNYDALEVPFTDAIPSDYDGAMGVPITFLDKYNPEQFEILSSNDIRLNDEVSFKEHGLIKDKDGTIDGKPTYVRIVIKHRKKIK